LVSGRCRRSVRHRKHQGNDGHELHDTRRKSAKVAGTIQRQPT
jgi:hypothetical protein